MKKPRSLQRQQQTTLPDAAKELWDLGHPAGINGAKEHTPNEKKRVHGALWCVITLGKLKLFPEYVVLGIVDTPPKSPPGTSSRLPPLPAHHGYIPKIRSGKIQRSME